MKRRLFGRLRGGEQDDGESEDFQQFHQMITDVNRDESRKLRIRKETFVPCQTAADDQQKVSKNKRWQTLGTSGPTLRERGSRGNVIERVRRKSNRFLPRTLYDSRLHSWLPLI